MYAERIIVQTDQFGHLTSTPQLPANKQIEAIFLVIPVKLVSQKRKPHASVVGKMQLLGDTINCAPAHDWDLA